MSKVLLPICLRQCQADIAEACLQSLASHLSDIWQLQVSDKPALSLKHDSANVLLTLLWCVQHTCLFNIVWQITWNDISYIIWRQVQTKSRIVQIVQVPLVMRKIVYTYTLFCLRWKHLLVGEISKLVTFLQRMQALIVVWDSFDILFMWINSEFQLERERVIRLCCIFGAVTKCPCISQDPCTLKIIVQLRWACF